MTNLQRIRTELGLSQSQLAHKACASVRTLQDYEQGSKNINNTKAITVYKLAKALECSVEDLLELENLDI